MRSLATTKAYNLGFTDASLDVAKCADLVKPHFALPSDVVTILISSVGSLAS